MRRQERQTIPPSPPHTQAISGHWPHSDCDRTLKITPIEGRQGHISTKRATTKGQIWRRERPETATVQQFIQGEADQRHQRGVEEYKGHMQRGDEGGPQITQAWKESYHFQFGDEIKSPSTVQKITQRCVSQCKFLEEEDKVANQSGDMPGGDRHRRFGAVVNS